MATWQCLILLNFSGISQFDPELVQNVSDFPASKALDNDLETYYHSESNSNASWFLKLNEVKVVKWILISTRGGNNFYTVGFPYIHVYAYTT